MLNHRRCTDLVFKLRFFFGGLVFISLKNPASLAASSKMKEHSAFVPSFANTTLSSFQFKSVGKGGNNVKEVCSQIYIKCKAVKEDRDALTMNKVGPANLFLQALVSFSKATLKNKSSIYRNYNPYQAYIQTLIKVRKWAKIRNPYNQAPHMTQELWTGYFCQLDFGSLGVTNHSGSNNRLFMMFT